MLDSKQEGTLAATHEGKPGLPRGRSRLPAPTVQASQRERLLRAEALRELEDTLVALHLAVLAARPWGKRPA
jgi:hypothetical protein